MVRYGQITNAGGSVNGSSICNWYLTEDDYYCYKWPLQIRASNIRFEFSIPSFNDKSISNKTVDSSILTITIFYVLNYLYIRHSCICTVAAVWCDDIWKRGYFCDFENAEIFSFLILPNILLHSTNIVKIQHLTCILFINRSAINAAKLSPSPNLTNNTPPPFTANPPPP